MEDNSKFTFIDLFSGIGGFRLAMQDLGGKCVFSSEIDKKAVETYMENFGDDSYRDIRKVNVALDIPSHDVLCAGFPCQSFSTAGKKEGFNDIRGKLFDEIVRILQYHHPKYIILENVKHLVTHDNGKSYMRICDKLKDLGYVLPKDPIILSPHLMGIPQHRERLYILGIYKKYLKEGTEYLDIKKEDFITNEKTDIKCVLDKRIKNEKKYHIDEYTEYALNAWDEFHQKIEQKTFGFPIWVDEFGATYDYSNFPEWKQVYVRKNREFYLNNKEFLDDWMSRYSVKNFKLRERKFEWQAGANYKSIWDTTIQLRQSGIRCKKTDYFPTLVAMVQTPIVGKYKRSITPREAARLQNFPDDYKLNPIDSVAYKQLGNSVNVEVVKQVASALFEKGDQ